MQPGTGSWFDVNITQPVQSLVNQLMAFLPTFLGALAILLVGWIIAQVIKGFVVRVLRVFDKLADQVQLSSVLAKGGIKRKFSELLGEIVYWLVMLAVVMAALNALQLTVAAELFQSVVTYLPNVIAAVFILVVGVFAAAFLATTVRTAASNAGILQSHLLSQAVQTIVVVFALVAALKQLHIQLVAEVLL